MTSDNEISVEHAREIARKEALSDLSRFIQDQKIDVLQEQYLEAPYCWMFFRNRKIEVDSRYMLGIEWAYVVSKRGTFSLVQDFSSDSERLKNYVETMSDYFKRKGK